ncbi:MAG: ATP-binding protein [Saprospiraceae bacterium]
MSRLIQNLQIKNFKSIRNLSLDCERINLFIGKPNAGKSNILEAISLLGVGYSEGKFMKGLIRYSSIFHLFNNFNIQSPISLSTNRVHIELKKAPEEQFSFLFEPLDFKEKFEDFEINSVEDAEYLEEYKESYLDKLSEYSDIPDGLHAPNISLLKQTRYLTIQQDGKILKHRLYGHNISPIKKYEFRQQSSRKENHSFLTPPHGGNFYQIARIYPELREEIKNFLQPNGLELLLDEESKRIFIVQREEASLISFPLHLVPDTFQRYIFHLAAIFSNQDSVLLFEEPETHSYAPYVYQLAQHILQDERNNQYFITTHNPYFLLPILQEAKDVAVFMTWFEDYQTHCRKLSEEEVREALDHGMDLFLNLDSLVPA